MARKLLRTAANLIVCKDIELLKVEVPLIRLGTEGVSLRREGRYHISTDKGSSPPIQSDNDETSNQHHCTRQETPNHIYYKYWGTLEIIMEDDIGLAGRSKLMTYRITPCVKGYNGLVQVPVRSV